MITSFSITSTHLQELASILSIECPAGTNAPCIILSVRAALVLREIFYLGTTFEDVSMNSM